MSENMNTLCEICGNIGFKHLLIHCRDCACSSVHQYCMDKVVFDASLADWLCYECLRKHGEVTCNVLLEKVSSERQPSNAKERNMDYYDISSGSQHDKAESSESSEIPECQKGSSYQNGKDVDMTVDYVLSRTSYLSRAQKKRVITFIQKSKPETTVFVAVMRKSNVKPPGPCLGISKEYAFAYFPHASTVVTLQRPGNSKKWHPIFYKKNESRKNMLMGQWLNFVRENHVQEGDICLLEPGKSEERSIFMVYLLRTKSAHSRCRAGSHMEKPIDEQHISSESGKHESPHGSLECKVTDGLPLPPYIVPCRSHLSKSQQKIVEEAVRAIQSEIPICVVVMKNNNVGVAQRWMLGLGSRFASVHLPAKGETVVLQCGKKIWETKMMYHTGRRWTLNGGWPQFARDNGLRVGDICLFELKKNEKKLTMRVHIISKQF